MREGALGRRRIDALDGVRGLAILLVLAFHLHWLGCGWIGVQLFFVLSGYLITRILLQDAQQAPLPRYLGNFYLRRVLRIMPLYFGYACIAAFAIAAMGRLSQAGRELAYLFGFAFNFYLLGGNPGPDPGGVDFRVFSHFWSLCVEEHFYLFWPLLVYFLRGRLLALTVGVMLAGSGLRALTALVWSHFGPVDLQANSAAVIYKLSTSHLDAFATGALLCVLPRASGAGVRAVARLFFAGLLAALVLGAWANHGWNVPLDNGMPRRALDLGFPITLSNGSQAIWGYSLINLLCAMLLWLAIHAEGFGRLFTQGWLRYTGQISYGMYVLHFPLMLVLAKLVALLRPLGGTAAVFTCQLVYLGLVYAAATLSFRWYEQRFLKLKDQLAARAQRTLPQPAQAFPLRAS